MSMNVNLNTVIAPQLFSTQRIRAGIIGSIKSEPHRLGEVL